MKNLLPTLFTAAMAVLPLSSSYAALDQKIVSADARWLLHVDFNLLRESEIGRELIQTASKNHPAPTGAPIQIDFSKVLAAIGSVTAYGANFVHDPKLIDGTLVVEGTADLRKIAEGYVAQAMLTTPDSIIEVKDLPFEAYSVHGDVFVGFPKEQIILVSKVKSQLARAYELYRGKGSSLAKASPSALRDLVPASRDAFLIAASIVPGETIAAESAPQARLIKMARSAALSLGEKDKLVFASVKLITDSTDTADKLQKIVQGLIAMASLAQTNDADLDGFIKAVAVERQDLAILLKLSYSSERLSKMIQSMQQDRGQITHEAHSSPAGKIIAEWKADQDLGSDQPSEKILAVHTIEHVKLASGVIIRISGKTDQGEHARIDYVDIQATDGSSQALKFEAEYMKLNGYQVEKFPAASGGKIILAQTGTGVAELQFPGATGDYSLKVHYLDETDGKSIFTVRVEEPAPESKDGR